MSALPKSEYYSFSTNCIKDQELKSCRCSVTMWQIVNYTCVMGAETFVVMK